MFSIRWTVSFTSFSLFFFRRIPKAMLSYTFRWGNRAYFWKMVFTSRL